MVDGRPTLLTKVAGTVRRGPGGDRLVEASKAAVSALRSRPEPLSAVPVSNGERFPHTDVAIHDLPTFDDLSEVYPEDRIPWIDRQDLDESTLTWEQLHWRRYGFVVLRGLLPDDLIDDYLAFREESGVGLGGFENTIWSGTPDPIKALGCHRPLVDAITDLLGEELAFNFILAGFVSSQREWHQDDYLAAPDIYGRYCAAWMALDDIHPDSGPFELVPGSHRWKGMRGHLVLDRLVPEVRHWSGQPGEGGHWTQVAECFTTAAFEAEIARTGSPVLTHLPRRGDVLLWHGKLVHRGSLAAVPGMLRPALICHYYPATMKGDLRTERFRDGGLYWPDKDGPPEN
jgi:hypothetical protein